MATKRRSLRLQAAVTASAMNAAPDPTPAPATASAMNAAPDPNPAPGPAMTKPTPIPSTSRLPATIAAKLSTLQIKPESHTFTLDKIKSFRKQKDFLKAFQQGTRMSWLAQNFLNLSGEELWGSDREHIDPQYQATGLRHDVNHDRLVSDLIPLFKDVQVMIAKRREPKHTTKPSEHVSTDVQAQHDGQGSQSLVAEEVDSHGTSDILEGKKVSIFGQDLNNTLSGGPDKGKKVVSEAAALMSTNKQAYKTNEGVHKANTFGSAGAIDAGERNESIERLLGQRAVNARKRVEGERTELVQSGQDEDQHDPHNREENSQEDRTLDQSDPPARLTQLANVGPLDDRFLRDGGLAEWKKGHLPLYVQIDLQTLDGRQMRTENMEQLVFFPTGMGE